MSITRVSITYFLFCTDVHVSVQFVPFSLSTSIKNERLLGHFSIGWHWPDLKFVPYMHRHACSGAYNYDHQQGDSRVDSHATLTNVMTKFIVNNKPDA